MAGDQVDANPYHASIIFHTSSCSGLSASNEQHSVCNAFKGCDRESDIQSNSAGFPSLSGWSPPCLKNTAWTCIMLGDKHCQTINLGNVEASRNQFNILVFRRRTSFRKCDSSFGAPTAAASASPSLALPGSSSAPADSATSTLMPDNHNSARGKIRCSANKRVNKLTTGKTVSHLFKAGTSTRRSSKSMMTSVADSTADARPFGQQCRPKQWCLISFRKSPVKMRIKSRASLLRGPSSSRETACRLQCNFSTSVFVRIESGSRENFDRQAPVHTRSHTEPHA